MQLLRLSAFDSSRVALKEEASAAADYLDIFFRRLPAPRSMHTNGCNVQAHEDEHITTASKRLYYRAPDRKI